MACAPYRASRKENSSGALTQRDSVELAFCKQGENCNTSERLHLTRSSKSAQRPRVLGQPCQNSAAQPFFQGVETWRLPRTSGPGHNSRRHPERGR